MNSGVEECEREQKLAEDLVYPHNEKSLNGAVCGRPNACLHFTTHTHTHTCRETITSHAIVGEPLTELIPNYEEH